MLNSWTRRQTRVSLGLLQSAVARLCWCCCLGGSSEWRERKRTPTGQALHQRSGKNGKEKRDSKRGVFSERRSSFLLVVVAVFPSAVRRRREGKKSGAEGKASIDAQPGTSGDTRCPHAAAPEGRGGKERSGSEQERRRDSAERKKKKAEGKGRRRGKGEDSVKREA